MQKKYVIGVDGGTESLRAGVFDLSGNPLAFASVTYPTHFPIPGWAEQNPEDWWNALGGAVRQAVIDANVAKQEILGICLDTTCCSVVARRRKSTETGFDLDGYAFCSADRTSAGNG